jgi:RNA polymerase sigma factor (sigma-70 family)
MVPGQLRSTLQHLRDLAAAPAAGLADGDLLERFLSQQDESAFEVLLRRHGPMVLNVCRRVLHDPHDAEDAFQATFLVFVRRAASIARRELLGNWLYGVAFHTARAARSAAGRRRAKEAKAVPRSQPPTESDWQDLQPLLDEELSHVPDKYRIPVVLCDLEGKSRREVAKNLGLAAGTLSSRLARGRSLLAGRLARRGVTVAGGALAVALGRQAATAALPRSLVVSTVKAGTLVLAGQAVTTAGLVSPHVAALTEGVLRIMFLSKLKLATVVLVVAGVLAIGIGEVVSQQLPYKPASQQGPRVDEGRLLEGADDVAVLATLKHVAAEDVAAALAQHFQGKSSVRVRATGRSNGLTIRGDAEDIQEALKLLRELDKPAVDAPLPERVRKLEREVQQWQERVRKLEKEIGEMRAERAREQMDRQIERNLQPVKPVPTAK